MTTENDRNPLVLDQLNWVDGEQRGLLPDWAKFAVSLGSTVAASYDEAARLVVGLSVPDRSFLAVLVTLGVVAAGTAKASDSSAHFRMLCELPVGTPVVLRSGTKRTAARLNGTQEHSGELKLVVQLNDRDKTRHLLPESLCGRVQVSDDARPDQRARRTEIRVNEGFIRGLLPSIDPLIFATTPHAYAILVGHLSALRFEVQVPFVVKCGGSSASGTLNDIVGLRPIAAGGQSFRTAVHPIDARKDPARDFTDARTVVVFDGSTAFVKWGHAFPAWDAVVVLDRTETRLGEASDLFNQMYLRRLEATASWLAGAAIPSTIETAAFREARR